MNRGISLMIVGKRFVLTCDINIMQYRLLFSKFNINRRNWLHVTPTTPNKSIPQAIYTSVDKTLSNFLYKVLAVNSRFYRPHPPMSKTRTGSFICSLVISMGLNMNQQRYPKTRVPMMSLLNFTYKGVYMGKYHLRIWIIELIAIHITFISIVWNVLRKIRICQLVKNYGDIFLKI